MINAAYNIIIILYLIIIWWRP